MFNNNIRLKGLNILMSKTIVLNLWYGICKFSIMKTVYLIFFSFLTLAVSSQNEFHVFPENDKKTPGTSLGNGSLQNPWDLLTALNQSSNTVNGGDIIWLHEGVYNGRFISKLNSTIKDKFITVSSFPGEWAIINGNVKSNKTSVLNVSGGNVVYKDFEVTWIGNFSRQQGELAFQKSDGISHDSGVNCKFINLVIHNNPGSGFGSWKRTGNTEINGCLIFNNGYYSAKRGSGVGMYVQNSTEENRVIKNNIIFNNYYKGIEIWSDNRKANEAYVKNIILENNVIFNSALVTGVPKDNLIIATNDNTKVNIAKNIKVINNIFYHNTDYKNNQIDGSMPSLTLGFNKNAPVENITLIGNKILGRNDGIRFLHTKSVTFKNNVVYSGFIRFYESFYSSFDKETWDFSSNSYFTRKNKSIRIQSKEDFTLGEWQNKYQIDKNSNWKNVSEFDMEPVLNITQNEFDKNKFRLVLFDKNEQDVIVDFSKYGINIGTPYTIVDVENHTEIIKKGILNSEKKVVFPMKLNKNDKNKSLDNFGVYIIEFKKEQPEKKVGFLSRIIKSLF